MGSELTKADARQEQMTLKIETEGGVWFVTSPQYPGLLVAKLSLSEALSDVVRALRELEIITDLGRASLAKEGKSDD